MTDPFADPRQAPRPPSGVTSVYPQTPRQGQRGYPPDSRPYTTAYDDHRGDMGYGRGGVVLNGQAMPWVAGEDDDERKPLTGYDRYMIRC